MLFDCDLKHWISMNFDMHLGHSPANWMDIFMTSCWMFWNWRNKEVHEENFRRPPFPHNAILSYAHTVKEVMKSITFSRNGRTNQEILFRWKFPPAGWCKLNTDGASGASSREAGCGGILRNDQGHWIGGFSYRIGNYTAIIAELWGILIGLEWAWNMGIKKIILECDSKVAVSMLLPRVESRKGYNKIVGRINKWLQKEWIVQVQYSCRETNRWADWLANQSLTCNFGLHVWNSIHEELESLMFAYVSGVAWPRTVPL